MHLCKEHGVRVQIGGSDQWGNITAGTDLIRKLLGKEEGSEKGEPPACYGLTFPLLVRLGSYSALGWILDRNNVVIPRHPWTATIICSPSHMRDSPCAISFTSAG